MLWDAIRNERPPACGFLLHAYGGPAEMIPGFAQLGAHFSFSPYFLHERKAAQREAFRLIPTERLLVETDAPDLRPPDEANPRPLVDPSGQPINHPANIDVAYRGLADIRGIEVEALGRIVSDNFARLFAD
jgi:TatD DNase family protein